MISFVLVRLWSKISAKSEIVQNDEKMTVFEGFKPPKRSIFGRSDRTRTCGIEVPNFARYQLRHTPIVFIFSFSFSMPPRQNVAAEYRFHIRVRMPACSFLGSPCGITQVLSYRNSKSRMRRSRNRLTRSSLPRIYGNGCVCHDR